MQRILPYPVAQRRFEQTHLAVERDAYPASPQVHENVAGADHLEILAPPQPL